MIQFVPAVKLVFKRWNDFDGRSSRSEYWWFALFCAIVNFTIGVISGVFGDGLGNILSVIFGLGAFIPCIALGLRRLHDTDRSGWWLLIGLVPLVGFVVLVYFFIQKGTEGTNRFGKDPLVGQPVKTVDPIA